MRATRSASVRPYSQQISRLSEIVEVRSPSPETFEGMKQLGEDLDKDDSASYVMPERSNSHHSMNIPIRRRSLQTPGIATRQSSRDDPYRKSLPSQISLESFQQPPQTPVRKRLPPQELPSQEELHTYYYDSSKSVESPLQELAGLEIWRGELVHPRTHTPNELEYGHIGSFKLGSLRITNGACSPSPSAHRETRTVGSSRDDDYLTCSEGRPSVDNPYRQTYDLETLKNFVTDHRGDDTPAIPPKNVFVEARSMSPLHQRQDATPDQTVTTTIQAPDHSLKLFNFKEAPAGMNPKSPTRAYELAQTYVQEIASSPFSFEESPPSSPQLEATSKNTATEDNLFEDELDSGVSLVNKPFRPDLSTTATMNSAPDFSRSSESRGRTRIIQGPRESNPKPLTKTDSGYNSNASLRSLKQRRLSNEGVPADMNAPGLPDKIPPPTPPKQHRHSYMSLPSQRNRVVEQAPPTPPKEQARRESYGMISSTSSTSVSQTYLNGTGPPFRQPPPVPVKIPSNSNSDQVPISPKETAEQAWAAAQSRPLLVIPKATMPRNLQRQSMPVRMDSEEIFQQFARPQQNLITVQGASDVHNREIPPIPKRASEALNERSKQFPAVMHTYKSVSRANSKETLATIFSMASAEQQAEELHGYDSLARVYENLPPGHKRLERSRSRESVQGMFIRTPSRNVTPQISRRQSSDNFSVASSARGRSRGPTPSHDFRESFEDQITSFNAVSNALGASPYDAALSASGPTSRSNSRPRTPPSATSRQMKRNTMGMDSPAASQFARERSRQRSLSRRASWDRPVTQTPSAYGSSPPVPSLPHSLMNDDFNHSPSEAKKTKSPPPVSMRGSSARKGPPPPAWASLSSAARDKMIRVYDSPPTSPNPRSPRSPPSATKLQLPKVTDDAEAERQREQQWEAQRRGWALRRENAGAQVEASNLGDQSFTQTPYRHPEPSSGKKVRPQSFAPPRSNTMTNISTTTTTTATGTNSLKGRRSWDTSTTTSVRGPSSTYSTYSESVYSNSSNTTQQPRTLTRTQSYGVLADHSPSKINNSTTTTTTTSFKKGTGVHMNENNYSNPHWRNLQRQPSNGTGYRGANGQTQPHTQQRWDDYSSYNGGWDSGHGNSNYNPHVQGSSYGNGGAMPVAGNRYSGGYGYGFEHGRGIQGTMGMRGAGSEGATRKGVEMRGRYGVDMGDVPVMAYA